jgi:C4-dicarboxylate transporter, DctM subunit
MEWYSVLVLIILLLLLFVSIGLPIPFALIAASLPFLWGVKSWSASLVSMEVQLWGVWTNYILLAVPLFIFLGELVGRSQIGPRLYDVLHRGLPIKGAAAYGSVGACAGFGALCGTSLVGTLTIGKFALPEMLDLGYGRRISAGIIAAGGTLSVLIPPSLILMYYGLVTNTSIGKLFLAGVVPGILLATAFVVTVSVWGMLSRNSVPASQGASRPSAQEVFTALTPVLLIGAVITVSIYKGIATPTEAAAVAVAVTIPIAFTVGRMTVKQFGQALGSTMITMGFIGILLAGAVLFGLVLTFYRIPHELGALVAQLELSQYTLILVIICFYLLIGMFLEPTSITFITLPFTFPLVKAAGFDLIWFGVIYTITMEIAVLTPPVGLNLYVIQRLAPNRVTVGDAAYGSLPFIAAMIALIALLMAFPRIVLWLPTIGG